MGRVIFSEIWPAELGFPNKPVKKSELGDLIWRCYKVCGHEKTVVMLDKLKELGFREATKAGVSIGIDDMIIPKEKDQEIEAAQKQIKEVEKQYRKGVITPGERYNKIVDIWTHCTDQIANVMFKTLEAEPGQEGIQPGLSDGGLRRARQPPAGAPARRRARPDGQAVAATSSRSRFCRTSAKASPCSNTSSPRTAPARVWPTPRSRPPTPVT